MYLKMFHIQEKTAEIIIIIIIVRIKLLLHFL